MIIGTINQTTAFETRVCITPQTAAELRRLGFDVLVEQSAGLKAGFSDKEYQNAGAEIKSSAAGICQKCDILLCLSPPTSAEIEKIKENTVIIGILEDIDNLPAALKKKKATCLALENLPRLSRAQPFDILSSQNNLSGYRAVIEAVGLSRKSSAMMITSAGTLPPLRFLIIGLGVAGLQAVATAKRLGGKVYVNDPRPETKEQAPSFGSAYV